MRMPASEAVLLVDANNAFNLLNNQAAIKNIRHLCPSISTILINTYREHTDLYVDGTTILSQERTIMQDDPLAMPLYALAILPLIHHVNHDIDQVWYADDATATGDYQPSHLMGQACLPWSSIWLPHQCIQNMPCSKAISSFCCLFCLP